MTAEEAIQIIEVAQGDCEWNAPLEYQDAFKMAIEALKEQSEHSQNTSSKQQDLETLGIKTGETCEDVISKQAAIDALKGLPTWWADSGGYYGVAQPPMTALLDPEDAISAIGNLPSAQPEIIQCKDCKHRYVEDMIWHCPFGLMGGENFFCGYGSLGTVERGTDG